MAAKDAYAAAYPNSAPENARKNGLEFRLPDKLRKIEVENNLAGAGSEAEVNDSLAGLLERCMK